VRTTFPRRFQDSIVISSGSQSFLRFRGGFLAVGRGRVAEAWSSRLNSTQRKALEILENPSSGHLGATRVNEPQRDSSGADVSIWSLVVRECVPAPTPAFHGDERAAGLARRVSGRHHHRDHSAPSEGRAGLLILLTAVVSPAGAKTPCPKGGSAKGRGDAHFPRRRNHGRRLSKGTPLDRPRVTEE